MTLGCRMQQVARNEPVFCTREQKANTTRGNRVQNTRPAVAGTNAEE
ncbi:hypothetical protein [Polluticaenibacter yanchengensis]|uniref:Uncharacterized protein n=1 Tax=Polluticaenibacter yanchengensis TaxID=3014562 RepID=A0ABT4UN10_9BACT|nr:hypothetical protein [Chitinophagaceae bacterium LY-5]